MLQHDPMQGRRLKLIRIQPEALMELFKNHDPVTLSFAGVPKDAKFRGCSYDITTAEFVAAIESQTYPEMPMGAALEYISISVTKYGPVTNQV